MPASEQFCATTVLTPEPMVIPDTTLDPRFAATAAVAEHGIRFYAGAPLTMLDGTRVGTLCVMDAQPREFGAEDVALLRDLARWAERELGYAIDRRRVRRVLDGLAPEPVEVPGYTVATTTVQPDDGGGDVVDQRLAADGALHLTVGTVAAGRASALLASAARGAVAARTDVPLERAVAGLEAQLAPDLSLAGAVATLVHARLDPESGHVDVVDLGHGLAAVVRAVASSRNSGTRRCRSACCRGVRPTVDGGGARPGDVLVLCSDGALALPGVDGLPDLARAAATGADAARALVDAQLPRSRRPSPPSVGTDPQRRRVLAVGPVRATTSSVASIPTPASSTPRPRSIQYALPTTCGCVIASGHQPSMSGNVGGNGSSANTTRPPSRSAMPTPAIAPRERRSMRTTRAAAIAASPATRRGTPSRPRPAGQANQSSTATGSSSHRPVRARSAGFVHACMPTTVGHRAGRRPVVGCDRTGSRTSVASPAEEAHATGRTHPAAAGVATRAAIIEGAAREFDERGYVGASMDGVAERAGVTKGALYFHFASKADLAGAVIARQHEVSRAYAEVAHARGRTPLESMMWMSQGLAVQMTTEVVVSAGIRLSTEPAGNGSPGRTRTPTGCA